MAFIQNGFGILINQQGGFAPQKESKMQSIFLDQDLHPFEVANKINNFGIKFAYWYLRKSGATRYQALRAIFFAI